MSLNNLKIFNNNNLTIQMVFNQKKLLNIFNNQMTIGHKLILLSNKVKNLFIEMK